MLAADGRRILIENVTQTAGGCYIVALREAPSYNAIELALLRSEENVSFLSTHDVQTRLPNRQALLTHLETMLPRLPDGTQVSAMVAIRLGSIRLVNRTARRDGRRRLHRALRQRTECDSSRRGTFCARLRSVVLQSFCRRPVRPTT